MCHTQTMFCGTGSFKRTDEDPWTPTSSAPGSPKGSKRKANKNPYSARGLDKFSTVVAELEARKEKIMEKAEGVSMIRFMYSNSQDWIPIIVRLREDAKDEKTKPADAKRSAKQLALPPGQPDSEIVKESEPPAGSTDAKELAKEAEPMAARKMKKCFSWSLKEGVAGSWRWRPSYYWPLVMVLMLVCLVTFGRVFAICCTSIWWYLVPTMKGAGSGNGRRSMKKKDYGRRPSDKRLGGTLGVAPSFHAKKVGGVQEMSSPRAHGNGKRG